MNIEDFAHAGDFEFETKALGTIYCEQLKVSHQEQIDNEIAQGNLSNQDIAFRLLLLVGHKPDPTPDAKYKVGGEKFRDEELAVVTGDEIDHFAQEFTRHNSWLLTTNENNEKITQAESESGSDFLVRASRNRKEYDSTRLEIEKARIEKLTKPFFSSSTLHALGESIKASDHIGKMLEQVRVGSTTSQLLREYERLNIGESIKASDHIGKTLEQVRVGSVTSQLLREYEKLNKLSDIAGESERLRKLSGAIGASDEVVTPRIDVDAPRFQMPENPIHETNRRLDALTEHMERAVLVSNATAELIQKLHDTAVGVQADYTANALDMAQQTRDAYVVAKWSFVISAIGFFATTVFSILSLFDTRESGEKSEQHIDAIHKEIQLLTAAQREDRAALAEAIRKLSERPVDPEQKSSANQAKPQK